MQRLRFIYESCSELVNQFSPSEVAFESLIYVKSVTSLAKLAQARGAMIAGLSKQSETQIFEYSPNLVKSSVTGHGHADKDAVAKSLGMILGIHKFKTADESDALAVAICHAIHRNSRGPTKAPSRNSRGSSLKSAFAHLAKEK